MHNLIQIMVASSLNLKLHHWHPTNAGQLGSNAEHIVLGELYDYLNEKVDFLVESIQGYNSTLEEIKIPSVDRSNSPEKTMEILCDALEAACEDKENPDWFINQLQEIQAELYKAKFKLKQLK